MKVITILQPWAELIVLGKKKIETRSFERSYRGKILIQASKKFTPLQRKLCEQWPFNEYMDTKRLEFGKIIGSAELTSIATTKSAVAGLEARGTESAAEEYHFGDYSEGRFAWYLQNPIKFLKTYPVKGQLSTPWTLKDPELIREIEKEFLINTQVKINKHEDRIGR